MLDNGANSWTINVGPTTAIAMSPMPAVEMSITVTYNEITKIAY